MKAYLLSLGCPRNLLDSEVLLALFEKRGFELIDEPIGADVAIVNTCSFIEDAKQESINAILQLVDLKKTGKIKKIVIAGCLPQRYPKELTDEIKEIDGMFGTADFAKIPDEINTLFSGTKVTKVNPTPDFLYDDTYERKLLTSRHSVYVKIQEGCSNRCTYCVIPELKGPRRSRSIGSIIKEVTDLKNRYDTKEIILIGQDTTSFGLDTSGTPELPELLKRVSPIMKDGWVRLLYTHPAHFTDELIDVFADTDNICKYIDLPIQHISDTILQKMNRIATKDTIQTLIERVRTRIKDVIIRTSVIVGFPGETEEQFRELITFLAQTKFDRLGAFIYSREEGTPAFEFEDQVPEEVKKERFNKVMTLQQKISAMNNKRYINKTLKVLIDEQVQGSPSEYTGRPQSDAPEVDGIVYVKGNNIGIGTFTNTKITGTMEYDLIGEAE